MAYYYRRNKNNQRSSWSKNYDDKKNEDTLIIDGNTVYEIDQECIKKLKRDSIVNENKHDKSI